jgi:biotin operon repressor/DNA-binding XRE family transcriptional regulator
MNAQTNRSIEQAAHSARLSVQAEVLAFLQRKCARNGSYSGTQTTIAMAIRRRSADAVGRNIAELRKQGRIGVTRHRHFCTYTVGGVSSVTTSEPPALSAQGAVLRFLRKKCVRGGSYSGTQETIAKATGWGVEAVRRNIAMLRRQGRIGVIPHGNFGTYTVIGLSVTTEPHALLVRSKVFQFLRRKCARGGSYSGSFSAIAKGIKQSEGHVASSIRKLRRRGLVLVSRGYRNAYTVVDPEMAVPERVVIQVGKKFGLNGQTSREPIGARLRAAREEAGFSREKAVKGLFQLGISITVEAVKKHESDKSRPRPPVQHAYSRLFKKPIKELFGA